MFADVILAFGAALLGTGVMTLISASRHGEASENPPVEAKAVATMILHAALAVVLAIAVRRLVTEVDSRVLDVALALLAAGAVGIVALRVARPASRNASVGLLLIVLGTMLCAAWLGNALLSDSTPTDSIKVAEDAASDRLPPALLSDPTGDCECDATEDLVAIGVGPNGTIYVQSASAPEPGARIWLWFERMPFSPIQAIAGDSGWTLEIPPTATGDFGNLVSLEDSGVLHLEFGFETGAVAATTDAGDRIPDVGYALPGGDTTEPHSTDSLVAETQSSFASLPTDHWQLTLTLLGAATTSGTFSYELGHARDAGAVHTREIVVGDDKFAIHDDGGAARGGTSLYFDRDGGDTAVRCSWTEIGTIECTDSTTIGPAGQLRDLLASPGSTSSTVVASRMIGGESASCVVVSAAAPSGPHVGEFCSFADGSLAFVDNRSDDAVFVLAERTSDLDPERLVVPETS